MSRSNVKRRNRDKRYQKIQAQFEEKMKERTASGAAPSTSSVVAILAEDWALSPETIQNILSKKL